jgi:AcrR family transcriptional regulator
MGEADRERMRRLPPGPHGLSPELVERNQRERLIAAMAEVCAERGYAESSVAEVAKRAGVSTASFYRQFKDKRECMLVSFGELFERLLGAIEAGCPAGATPAERAREGARTAARLLAADLPTARLLSIEVIAVGPAGVRAQQAAIERLAALLEGTKKRTSSDPSGSGPGAGWTIVAAMVSMVGGRVAAGSAPTAAELEAIASLL